MNVNQPAFQAAGTAVTVAASVVATSSRVAVETAIGARHVRIYNASVNDVFIEIGNASVAAAIPVAGGANGGMGVRAGTTQIFALTDTNVALIAAVAGPSLVYLTPGEGLD